MRVVPFLAGLAGSPEVARYLLLGPPTPYVITFLGGTSVTPGRWCGGSGLPAAAPMAAVPGRQGIDRAHGQAFRGLALATKPILPPVRARRAVPASENFLA